MKSSLAFVLVDLRCRRSGRAQEIMLYQNENFNGPQLRRERVGRSDSGPHRLQRPGLVGDGARRRVAALRRQLLSRLSA